MRMGLVLLGLVLLPAPQSWAGQDDLESVVVRGQRLRVWPVENLRARGYDVTDVPHDVNAAWVYIDAINAYEDLPKSLEAVFQYAVGHAWPDAHPELDAYLDLPGNREAMELAHRASEMRRCQMPYFGDPKSSILGMLLPNLSGWRTVGKLIVAEGKRLEAQGRIDQSVERYLTAMRMGAHAAEGATLIEGLVGMAIWTVADRALVDLVLRRPLSAGQLAAIQRQLEDHALRLPTVERGLQGEKALGPAVVDELCSRPFRVLLNLHSLGGSGSEEGFWFPLDSGSGDPRDGWDRLELRIGRLMLPDRAVKEHMSGYYDRVIDRARSGPVSAAADEFDEEQYVLKTIPHWDIVSRMLLPSLSRATQIGERAKADLASLRTIVALRLYMLNHYGRPPAELAELEELLEAEAMTDPFSGEPLIYGAANDGWILYSVGPNLIDDGGQAGKRWDRLDMVHKLPPDPVAPFNEDEGN